MTSLEYLAGMIEVAGCLMIIDRKDRPRPTPVMMIQDRREEIPRAFANRFGGKVTKVNLKGGFVRYAWMKRGKPAQDILAVLRPHVRIRSRDFDRLLSLEVRNRGGQRFRPQPTKSIGAALLSIAA